jgi:hypothetical protein
MGTKTQTNNKQKRHPLLQTTLFAFEGIGQQQISNTRWSGCISWKSKCARPLARNTAINNSNNNKSYNDDGNKNTNKQQTTNKSATTAPDHSFRI